MRAPIRSWALLGALLFEGVSALLGGAGLVADPTGGMMRMPAGLLHGTPFSDYRVPGLILVVVLGVLPLVVAAGLWLAQPWARPGASLVGVALVVWIGIQVAMIGYQHPVQPFYAVVGIVIIVLSLPRRARS